LTGHIDKNTASRTAGRRWAGAAPILAALALAGLAQLTLAAEPEEEQKAWKEAEAALPAYPKADDLVSFPGAGQSPHQFLLDTRTLAIGADGVVRYTLVIKTAGGATNVAREGIRCEARELKTYAIGQKNATWQAARDPQWRRIEYRAVNNYHGTLYTDFLCDGSDPVKNVQEIVKRLRYPAHPTQIE
jgi:hypothetical protein